MSRKNWTASELARRSKLAPSTLLRALNNREHHPFVFALTTLEKIGSAAGEPVPIHLAQAVQRRSPPEPLRSRLIQVRNVSALPTAIQSSFSPAKGDSIAVPANLREDMTAFAFRNPDDSLGAWFPPRSLMFASKARDPIGGDLVMLTGRDGRTRVRLLLGISEDGLSLSRTMPAKEDEKVSFDDIGEVAVILEVVRD